MCNNYLPIPNTPNAARMQSVVQPTQPVRTVPATQSIVQPTQPVRTTPATQRTFQCCTTDVNTVNPQYIQYTNTTPVSVAAAPSTQVTTEADSVQTTENNSGSECTSPLPETLVCYEYIPGFLRAHVGDLVRVEFLMYDSMTDRVGVLNEVGASYIVLESLDGSSRLMCDLFSIKFVTIMQKNYADYATIQAVETSRISFKG